MPKIIISNQIKDAFNVLGFAEQEKFDCYMLTAGMLNTFIYLELAF